MHEFAISYGLIEKVRLAGEGCLKKKKNQFAKLSNQSKSISYINSKNKSYVGSRRTPFFVIEIVKKKRKRELSDGIATIFVFVFFSF